MTLVDRIASRYRDLTANEKRIFNLMSSDVKSFALHSIGDIASQLDISKTTLMRFAKSCGFNGYSDFKRALQKEVLLDSSPVRKMKRAITRDEELDPEELYRQELENITTTYGNLNEDRLATVTRLLSEAKELYTLSWGVSNTVAEIFAFRMHMMGIRCTPLTRKHGTLIEETFLVKPGDLVLVFEIPPYNRETMEALQKLQEREVQLIVITDSPRCPLAEFASHVFYCATGAKYFGNSMNGLLFWVNLVSSLVMYRKKDQVLDILEDRQLSYNNDKYYYQ